MVLPNVKIVDRLCIALIVFVLLLAGYWQLSRIMKEENLFRRERDQLSKQMADKALAEKNIEKMRLSVRSSGEEIANLQSLIPEDPGIGSFLKQLAMLMNKRGVVLISVQPQQVVKEKLCLRIPVRVSCKGPFAGLYGLLRDLDTIGRLVVVERMSLVKPGEAGQCQLDLTALVFARQPQPSKTT